MNKKVMSLLIAIGMLSTMAFAGWYIGLTDTVTANVISEEEGLINIQTSMQDFGTIDATNTSQTITKTAVIQNNNGIIPMLFNVNVTKTDIVDDCTDYTNDITETYKYNDVEITNGQTINMTSGLSNYTITLDVIRSACPQNVSITSTFEEVLA